MTEIIIIVTIVIGVVAIILVELYILTE